MSTRTEQEVAEALSWAVGEAEAELRGYPAYRLPPQSELGWSLDAPNGVGAYVEVTPVTQVTLTTATAVVVLVASTTGLRSLFRRRQLERTVELRIDGG